MRHRHSGPKVRYHTRRDNIRFRKRPLHNITYIKPKQPKKINKIPEGDYITEEKMDDVRTEFLDYGNTGRFINRRKIDKTKQYPEFKDLARRLPGKNIIDGGVVAFNKGGKDDFKLLSERDHLKDEENITKLAKEKPLTFMAFDILNYNGRDTRDLPWEERKKILNSLPQSKHFKIVKSYPKEKARELLKDKSIEGVVFKKIDSLYNSKENDDWLKIKQQQDADVVITGYKEGEGKRKGMVGALYTGIWDGNKIKDIGKVGTGFDNKEGVELKKKLDKIRTKIEDNIIKVKPKLFAKLTYLKKGSQGKLREPVFTALRDDIGITDTHASRPIKIEKKGRFETTRSPKEVISLAHKIKRDLEPFSKRIELAGSIRRKSKNPVDIDLVIIPKNKDRIIDYIGKKGKWIQQGELKIASRINDIKTEVNFTDNDSWGSTMMFATGPYGANIHNRNLAKQKGLLLNQYGLFKRTNEDKAGQQIAGITERNIYNALGKSYREPELRGLPR